MKNGLSYFFLIVTFILGVSVGIYSGYENENNLKISQKNSDVKNQPIQDVVIKKVQNEKENVESGENDVVVETIKSEEKISPYAKLVIKKHFSKCNHITVNIVDVPKELVNLPKSELMKKYTGWKIEKFSTDEIILSREIEANCEDHFVLKEKDGSIAVYSELTEDKMNLVEVLSVNTDLLSEVDKENLKEGIRVYGKQELNSIIEDYNS